MPPITFSLSLRTKETPMSTHSEGHARSTLMTRVILRYRALLALLFTIWLGSVAAIAQCNTSLQSGGPIATLRGEVGCSVLWDPDGTGPLPTWLVVGGRDLTGGDQPAWWHPRREPVFRDW